MIQCTSLVILERQDKLCVFQFSMEPNFENSYLYYIYRPYCQEGFVLYKEEQRRTNYIVTEIVLDMILGHGSLFGLHASTVSYCGAGVVFAGRAGAGKTILSMAFCCNGALLLSDDISIISPEGLLLPFEHKPLTLRPATVEYLAKQGLIQESMLHSIEEMNYVLEAYAYTSEIFDHHKYSGPARLAVIVIPVFCKKTDKVQLGLLDSSRAVTELLPYLMPWTMKREKDYSIQGKYAAVMDTMRHLLTNYQVKVLHLEYGIDPNMAVKHIIEYLGP